MRSAIAVISAGCVLPGGHSVERFWATARTGHRFHGSIARGFAPDAARLGVRPEEIPDANPMQWLTVEAGVQAAEAVRVLPRARTAVLLGASGLGSMADSGLRIHLEGFLESAARAPALAELSPPRRQSVLDSVRREFDARLRPSSADPVIGSLASVAAARIAARFDLRGAHYALDADHASALAALELAIMGLDEGEWDCALAGAASDLLTPLEFVAYSKLGWLSPDARLGEGAAMFALKRLEDAERDGEKILAVITGTGASGPGAREAGVASAARAAWSRAGVRAHDVDYVECDAPGLSDRDTAEARALASLCEDRESPLPVSSGAGASGHLRAASGAAAVLRAVMALQHREIPPVARGGGAFAAEIPRSLRAVRRAERWARCDGLGVRRAGVSAISLGGQCFHAVLESPRAERSPRVWAMKSRAEPLAIVAMAGIYPGAHGVEAFWQGLLAGEDRVGTVPASRWDFAQFGTSDSKCRERSYARHGAFLEALPDTSRDDASHALALEIARDARAAAGHGVDPERVRVFAAYMPFFAQRYRAAARVGAREYTHELARALSRAEVGRDCVEQACAEAEADFVRDLPEIDAASMAGWLASSMAESVARELDAAGPCVGIESACASTLAALHAASLALSQRAVDAAVVCGAFCDLSPEFYVACSRFRALSPDGIRPFGANPRGFVPGEGGGLFVLKRLADAERDGDRVFGIVRSVSGSSDGAAGQGSVLRPAVSGEVLAIERSLERAGISAADVGYVECHGAGTAVGDAAEVAALGATYGTAAGRTSPLRVGAVKSNLGHLCAAAAAPALTKAVLAVSEGVIPRSLHGEPRNPDLDFASAGIDTVSENANLAPGRDGVRRAGVSAFGLGGTNFHAIVEAPPGV